MFLLFFFSVPTEKKEPKRELVARSGSEGISTLRTELRDSLRSNKSSLRLTAPFSVVAFLSFPSRYRNLLRSKGLSQRSKALLLHNTTLL